EDEFHPCDGGQNFTGQVVLGWPQTSGGDNQISPVGCDTEGRYVLIKVIGQRGMKSNGEAMSKKLPAQPLAVGIQVTARGEFGADGDDFDFHSLSIAEQGL